MRARPPDPPPPTLALVAAVALHEVLQRCSGDATVAAGLRIKWPNDILAGGAKIAGILLERSGEAVVIGFGANLTQAPSDLDRPATSIAALTRIAPDPALVGEDLAASFAGWLNRWRREGLEPIRQAWLTAAHAIGTLLNTAEGQGTFDGLEPTGALRLKLPDGSVRLVHAGDVFLL